MSENRRGGIFLTHTVLYINEFNVPDNIKHNVSLYIYYAVINN